MPTDLFANALAREARALTHCQPDLRALIPKLPESDAELDGVLRELIAERDSDPFSRIWMAAHAAERKIAARHLVEGGALFGDIGMLISTAWRCTGDVCEALLAAVRGERMGTEREVASLAIAAQWWLEHREPPFPAELIIQSRKLARADSWSSPVAPLMFTTLANLTEDDGLLSILESRGLGKTLVEPIDPIAQEWLEAARLPDPLALMPEKRPERVLSGYTVRRAVPKTGRNDPCHCGSGKKYKKCCAATDQARLTDSSEVEGVTLREMELEPERYLTRERIYEMRSYEVYKLDPAKVPPELLPEVIGRLSTFSEFERICQIVETLESREEMDEWMEWALREVMWEAGNKHRPDIVKRLLATHPPMEAKMHLSTRLLICDDPGELLKLLETNARKCLASDVPLADEANVAHGMLNSAYPALGILLARSAALTTAIWNVECLVEEIERTRDELELSPFDIAEEIYQQRLAKESATEEAVQQEEASREMEENRQEMNQLRLRVERLQREVANQQQPEQKGKEAPDLSDHTGEDNEEESTEVRALRDQLAATREELKLKHAERNDLRRDLKSARDTIGQLQNHQPGNPGAGARLQEEREAAAEEDRLAEMPAAHARNWPLRLPVFPEHFLSAGSKLPAEVLRAAMILASRLASGEPGATTGVRPLKMLPHVYRQKVSRDYRLFFELAPGELRVIELIHRRDLDTWIKRQR